MILQLNIKDVVDNSSQPRLMNYGLTVKIGSTTVINEPDVDAGGIFPISTTATTSIGTLTVGITQLGGGGIKFDINKIRIWQGVPVEVYVLKSGYVTYHNIFTIYGYDLGTGALPIPQFNIYMISNAALLDPDTISFASVIAYRKPFTNKIYYYKNLNTTGTNYYNSTSGTDILLSTDLNGFTTGNVTTDTIKAIRGGTTWTFDIVALKWTPTYGLSASGSCSTCDCVSTQGGNSAQVDIDYSTLSTIRVNGDLSYPYQNQQIEYNLYDISGTLIATKKFGFVLGAPTFSYDPSLYVWDTWTVPEAGSYVIEACLSVVDNPTGVTIYNEDLEIDTWYSIIAKSGSPDFTNVGAPDNNIGTDFDATGTTPSSWGTSSTLLEVLGNTIECCTRLSLNGCTWFSVSQSDCNKYLIKNLQTTDVTFEVFKMLTTGEFDTTAITDGTIPLNEEEEITLDDDGVYMITLNNGTDTLSQIVFNNCKIKRCALSFINSLMCKCACGDHSGKCEDFCKKYYDFNAYVTLSQTLYKMIETYYTTDKYFIQLSEGDLNNLFEVQQVMDKLQEYCGTCCEGCKEKRTGCGCKK